MDNGAIAKNAANHGREEILFSLPSTKTPSQLKRYVIF